jgi:hypothetical protein
MIILEEKKKDSQKFILYTHAQYENICDKSDNEDARHERQSNMLPTVITVDRLLGNLPHTRER